MTRYYGSNAYSGTGNSCFRCFMDVGAIREYEDGWAFDFNIAVEVVYGNFQGTYINTSWGYSGYQIYGTSGNNYAISSGNWSGTISYGSTWGYSIWADYIEGSHWSGTTVYVSHDSPQWTPNAVSNCKVTQNTIKKATISWSRNTTGARPYNGYYIQRAGSDGVYTTIATITNGSTTSYVDTSFEPGDTYTYRVAPYNNGGTGSYTVASGEVYAYMPPTISNIQAYRVNENGKKDDVGNYLKVDFEWKIDVSRLSSNTPYYVKKDDDEGNDLKPISICPYSYSKTLYPEWNTWSYSDMTISDSYLSGKISIDKIKLDWDEAPSDIYKAKWIINAQLQDYYGFSQNIDESIVSTSISIPDIYSLRMDEYYDEVSSLNQYYSRGKCNISYDNISINEKENSNIDFISTNASSDTISKITLSLKDLYFKHIEFEYNDVSYLKCDFVWGSGDSFSQTVNIVNSSDDSKSGTVSLDMDFFKYKTTSLIISFKSDNNNYASIKNIKYFTITNGIKKDINKVLFKTNNNLAGNIKVKTPNGKIKNAWLYKPNKSDTEFNKLDNSYISESYINDNNLLCVKSNNNNLNVKENILTLTNAIVINNELISRNIDIEYTGGSSRNLLSNTRAFGTNNTTGAGLISTSTYATIIDDNYNNFTVRYLKNTLTSTSQTKPICEYRSIYPDEYGESYTLSFWAKGSGSFRTYFYGDTGYVQIAKFSASDGTSGTSTDGAKAWTLTSDWTKYNITYTLKSSGDLTIPKYLLFRQDGNLSTELEIYLCGLKFEKGITATDWTSALEDVNL